MSAGAGRVSRDALLGRAAAALAAGATLAVISYVLRFIQVLEVDTTTDFQVEGALRLLGSVLLIAAYATASTAFFLDIQARTARLGKAAQLAAAAYVAFTAGELTPLVVQRLPGKFVALYAVGVAASLALLVAASVTAVAFNGFARGAAKSDRILRDGRLGRANISLAVGGLLLVIKGPLGLSVDRVYPGISNAGVIVEIIGNGILIAAGIIAAVAFLISRQDQQRRLAWMSRRDGRLALSTAVFAVVFITLAIGSEMQAGAWSGRGVDWKIVAVLWLSAATNLIFTAAAVTASVGFFRSSNSSTDAGSDHAGVSEHARVNLKKTGLATGLLCLAIALAGCGGTSSTENNAEKHLAALANAACRESHTNRATGAPFEAHIKAEFAKVRALIHADRKLPRVATLTRDLAARKREQVAVRKLFRKGDSGALKGDSGAFFSGKEGEGANPFSLLNKSYRLAVEVQADLKALGLTSCLGPTPRKPIGG